VGLPPTKFILSRLYTIYAMKKLRYGDDNMETRRHHDLSVSHITIKEYGSVYIVFSLCYCRALLCFG